MAHTNIKSNVQPLLKNFEYYILRYNDCVVLFVVCQLYLLTLLCLLFVTGDVLFFVDFLLVCILSVYRSKHIENGTTTCFEFMFGSVKQH